MSTLWTFGDSALERKTRLRPDMPKHEVWTEILARKLGMNLKDFSWGASSIDYTFFHYRNQCDKFEPGDVVIVGITDLNRGWFLQNSPAITTIHRINSSNFVTEEQKKAIDIYFRDFYREDIDIANIKNFLDLLLYHQETKDIVIIAFCTNTYTYEKVEIPKKLGGSIGTLWHDVSMGEIVETEEEFGIVFHDIQYGCRTELRLNHMVEENHITLANKALHSVMTKEPIDFTTGFVKNVLSIEELKNG